jgi:hypothetical protein
MQHGMLPGVIGKKMKSLRETLIQNISTLKVLFPFIKKLV